MSKILQLSEICGKKFLTLLFISFFSLAQLHAQESVTVTGKVSDEKGLAMPAVSVKLKVPPRQFLLTQMVCMQ